MRKNKWIGLVMCCLATMLNVLAQPGPNTMSESWKGSLHVPTGDLEVILHFKQTDAGTAASLDVPVQHAKGIKASFTRLEKDSVLIEFQLLMARYRGIYKRDSAILIGEWEQNGFFMPLKLIPTGTQAEVKRPQDPVKPYPYNEEEVTFENVKEGVHLAGTLTWPKGKSACPAVILITGSGSQNRDEELMGHRPFLVLADALTRRGIAVLRYDDRGVGKSTGNPSLATTDDFSNDAEAAFTYLKTRKEVDPKKIGFAGHSEGGEIAPMVASRHKDVGFIILLAGPGLKGSELLVLQARALSLAAGMSETEVKEKEKINKKIYDLASRNLPGAADSIVAILEAVGMPTDVARIETRKSLSPWLRYFLNADPAVFLSKTTCPVFALNGKKDLQVPYKENTERIESALKKGKNKQVTIKVYDDLNHLFQHCRTGMPTEYETIEESMSPEVLTDIGNWILKINAL